MTCDLKNRNEIIADYLTDELNEQDMLAFEQHYFQCKVCFQELKLCERAVNLIKHEGEAVFSHSGSKWTGNFGTFLKKLKWKSTDARFDWRYVVAFGAVILILAISLPIAIRQYKNSLDQREIIAHAENFKPSAKFDNLMQQIYLSNIVLITVRPHNDANFKNEILFQWEIKKNDLPYKGLFELKIYDNKENTLHRFFIRNNQFQLNEALSPGLYYWSLMTEDEMVHLGRFYVQKPPRF
jgi:hypothetical protein